MAIKPIPFNTETVRAILEGRKAQTRLIAFKHDDLREFRSKAYPDGWWYVGRVFKSFDNFLHYYEFLHYPQCPRCKYAPDDILWVREMWRPVKGITHTYVGGEITESSDWHSGFEYKTGGLYFPDGFKPSNDEFHLSENRTEENWRPSRCMPKEAARIFLRVKDVRVQRLNSMSEEDAIAEGFTDSPAGTDSPLERYSVYWDKHINRDDLRGYGWHENPWVWVIEFERCKKPEGWGE